jgi:hypothetical protein
MTNLVSSVEDVVEDLWNSSEEAFDTNRFLMVWLDPFGKVVRSKRRENSFQDMFNGMFGNGAWIDMEEWTKVDIGDEYKSGGVHENLYFLRWTV